MSASEYRTDVVVGTYAVMHNDFVVSIATASTSSHFLLEMFILVFLSYSIFHSLYFCVLLLYFWAAV